MRRPVSLVVVLAIAGGIAGDSTRGGPEPELARQPSWTAPEAAEVRRRAVEWASDQAGPEAAARVEPFWEAVEAGVGDRVDAAMATAAAVDPRADAVRSAGVAGDTAGLAWLNAGSTSDFGRQAVKLWLGRELVRHDRFDEALPLLADLDIHASIDPATVLFHRGCCQHWLLDREGAIESFDLLLEREADLPVRFARLARLLQADLAAVRPDSLDHIARRMRDVRRRLDQGRAGPETRRVQEGVIESLDKLIAELEQQQQQQGQSGTAGSGGGGQGGAAGRPMDESKLARGLGKGQVKPRDIGTGDGWGDLPPHQREAALQQIGREYPPHYREAIEEYFKRLATGGEEGP